MDVDTGVGSAVSTDGDGRPGRTPVLKIKRAAHKAGGGRNSRTAGERSALPESERSPSPEPPSDSVQFLPFDCPGGSAEAFRSALPASPSAPSGCPTSSLRVVGRSPSFPGMGSLPGSSPGDLPAPVSPSGASLGGPPVSLSPLGASSGAPPGRLSLPGTPPGTPGGGPPPRYSAIDWPVRGPAIERAISLTV